MQITNQTSKGHSKIDLGKYLVQNLFYPAVLGSFLFKIIDNIALKIAVSTTPNFLSGDPFMTWLKGILALAILAFYCCDYLYSYVVKTYKTMYFGLDAVAITTLTVAFFSLRLDKTDPPSFHFLASSLILFMAVFFAWDTRYASQIQSTATGKDKMRRDFFTALADWQLICLCIITGSYILWGCDQFSDQGFLLAIILTVAWSAHFYFTRVDKKADLF